MAILQGVVEELNSGLPRTNPASGRMGLGFCGRLSAIFTSRSLVIGAMRFSYKLL